MDFFLAELFTKYAKRTNSTHWRAPETFNDNYNFINVFLQLQKR